MEKNAKSIHYIYQVKATKKAARKQHQCRANTHYSPALASGPTARELKNAIQNLTRGTKLIASKKLTFDWLAPKFRRRFHDDPTVSGISEHQSD